MDKSTTRRMSKLFVTDLDTKTDLVHIVLFGDGKEPVIIEEWGSLSADRNVSVFSSGLPGNLETVMLRLLLRILKQLNLHRCQLRCLYLDWCPFEMEEITNVLIQEKLFHDLEQFYLPPKLWYNQDNQETSSLVSVQRNLDTLLASRKDKMVRGGGSYIEGYNVAFTSNYLTEEDRERRDILWTLISTPVDSQTPPDSHQSRRRLCFWIGFSFLCIVIVVILTLIVILFSRD